MKIMLLFVTSLVGSASAMACAFAGYETLSGQIADDVNGVYENKIDTSCAVARAKDNRFRCSVACIDFKAHFSMKADREVYVAVVTAATQKSLGEVVPSDFVTLSVMDGYLASRNATAVVDVQRARGLWLRSRKSGFDLFKKKLAGITKYQQFMTNKPMLSLD